MNWLNLLKTSTKKTLNRNLPTSKHSRHSLCVEALEDRMVPVVGAFAALSDGTWPLPPQDLRNTGVVRIDNLGQGVFGSGSLLWTGRHILTAAHVLDDNGDRRPDAGGFNVTFVLGDGTTRAIDNIPSSAVRFPSTWTGAWNGGSDIAIIELPALAPLQVERYQIYQATNEVGQIVTVSGFGATGNGAVGLFGGNGVRRAGENRIDTTRVVTSGPSNSIIRMDFDSGRTVNDFFGRNTGLGTREAKPDSGDSGGPAFIGRLIAGVFSGMGWNDATDTNSALGTFGEWAEHTRVSSFANWIRTNVNTTMPLFLDMRVQGWGGDGVADLISMQFNSNVLTFSVNGRIFTTTLTGSEVIKVQGASDNEMFIANDNIQALSNTKLEVHGGSGNDEFSYTGLRKHTWQITGFNNSIAINGRVFLHTMENLRGGAGEDIFQFFWNGGVSGRISGGGGVDTLDYQSMTTLGTTGVRVDLVAGTATRVSGGINGIRNVNGSSAKDFIYGNNLANVLQGFGGNDELHGREGNDILRGGQGDDTLYGNAGYDTLEGQEDNDYLDGGRDGMRDMLKSGTGRDRLVKNYYLASLINWVYETDSTDFSLTDDAWISIYHAKTLV
ncbi:MAG: trypsin-like serine protease [Planctomycetia bacterium]|nr:trypsin-like serine protease [Planctomycetia bacterium]